MEAVRGPAVAANSAALISLNLCNALYGTDVNGNNEYNALHNFKESKTQDIASLRKQELSSYINEDSEGKLKYQELLQWLTNGSHFISRP